MKTNQLKIICTLLFCIGTIYTQAQLICELGQRTTVVGNSADFELSALAYHQNRKLFFMPLDDPLPNTTAQIRGYDHNANLNTQSSFNVGLDGGINAADFEGLTWLEEDYFVLVEETRNEVYFLQYVHSSNINNRKFVVLGSHLTGIDLVPNSTGIDGLEGITYNPHLKTLYLVSEVNYTLYSIPIELPKASNNNKGKLLVNQKSEVQLPFDASACASGIFHLGLNVAADHPLVNNILVLSDQLKKVFEFEMILDANNNLTNNSLGLINEFSLPTQPQAEGIVVVDNELYISSEKTGGGLSSYTIKTENDSCNDGNANTINDRYDSNCDCVGDIPGCIDQTACNFNALAMVNDGSCTYPEPNFDCNGNCLLTVDCQNSCGGQALAGTACNDGNMETINDTYDQNCLCSGELACKEEVVISANASPSNIPLQNLYESSQSITTQVTASLLADIIIHQNETVNLKSDYIMLNEGFKVESGGCLNAEIEPCEN